MKFVCSNCKNAVDLPFKREEVTGAKFCPNCFNQTLWPEPENASPPPATATPAPAAQPPATDKSVWLNIVFPDNLTKGGGPQVQLKAAPSAKPEPESAEQDAGEVTTLFRGLVMDGEPDQDGAPQVFEPAPPVPRAKVATLITGPIGSAPPPGPRPLTSLPFDVHEDAVDIPSEPGEVTRMFDTMRRNDDSQPGPVPPPVMVTRSATGESHVAATSPPSAKPVSAFSFTVPEEENPSGSAEEPGEVTRMFDTMRSNEDSQPGPVPPPVMVTRSATGESHVAASGSTSGISAARPPDPLGFNNPFEEEFVAKPPVPPAASRSADPLGFGTPFVEEDEPSAPATQEPGEVTRMFDTMRGNDDSQPGPVPPPVMVTRSATGESHVAATSPPSAKPVSAFSFTVPEEENPSGSAEEPGEVTRMFDTMRSNEDSQPAPVPPPVIVTRSATGESHVAATSPPASPADARAAMFGNPNEFEKAEPTVQLDAEPSAPVAAPAPDPTLHSWMNVVEANPALSELPSAEEDRGGSRTLITVSPFYEGGDPKAAPAVLEPKPAPKGFQGLGAAPQPAVAAYRETTLPPQGPAPAPVGPPPAPAPPAPNVTLPPFDSEEVPEFLREVSPVKPADTTDVMRNPYFAPAGSAARLGAAAPLMADRIRTETSQPAVQVNLEEAEEIEMEQAEKTVQVRAPAPPPLMPTATPGALVDLPPPRPTLVQAPQPVQQFEPVLGADEHTLQQDAGPEFDEVKSSNMLLVAGLIAGAALLGGAAWFFLFRETDKPEQTVPAEPSAAESAPAPTPAKPESPPEAAPTPALAPEKPSAPNIPGGPRELTREQIRDELFGQGNRLYHEGEYEKAIEKYKEVVQVDANYAIVHRTLGSCYALLDMPVEACASYARYLELALDAPDRDKVQEEIDRCRKPVKKGKKKGR